MFLLEDVAKQFLLPPPLERARSLKESLKAWWCPAPKREFWALRNISCIIQPGEQVALMGENGAGKSTLLKIMSNIILPTAGRCTQRGKFVTLLGLGAAFHPELTGKDNIFLKGLLLGMRTHETARVFDAIVDFAGIAQFVDVPIKRYSHGMLIRLAFAIAAHTPADGFIFDEIFAVADNAFRAQCCAQIARWSEQGKTLILVSHQQELVDQLCKRAIVLSGGELVFDGTR